MSVNDRTASDYRGSQNAHSSSQVSYSSVTKIVPKPTFPKKDQAIVFHAEDDLKLLDYVKAVGDLIGPKKITFASRISNNRICIYLITKEIVDHIISTQATISVGGKDLTVRRLISPSKRIIISNISPSIPHDIIELALKDLGLNLTSPIMFLKASIPGEEYGHILSFRRQVFVLPPSDGFQIQTSLLVTHDGTEHRVFISTDRMECFICKETGHIAANCTNSPTNISNDPTDTGKLMDLIPQTSSTLNQKRCLSDITTSDQSSSVRDTQENLSNAVSELPPPPSIPKKGKSSKSARKKRKINPTPDTPLSDATRQLIRDRYEASPQDYVISIDNFFAFLENSFGSSNPLEVALGFTQDIKTLLSNMYAIYPFLVERSIKNRFTRLYKKLKSDAFEVASISSLQSQSSMDDNSGLDELQQSDDASIC
ncbi:hypothetical protein ABEB36_005609 [Hypothenemus hampei]|uniref:CCHC-type domain-containing protein n=1 Tax=Hypothenemus hampei TaxID=57062 RepID=A0ABD1EYU4_HYPHA